MLSLASEFDRQIRSQHHPHVVPAYPNAGRVTVFVCRMEIAGEREIPEALAAALRAQELHSTLAVPGGKMITNSARPQTSTPRIALQSARVRVARVSSGGHQFEELRVPLGLTRALIFRRWLHSAPMRFSIFRLNLSLFF